MRKHMAAVGMSEGACVRVYKGCRYTWSCKKIRRANEMTILPVIK